MSATELAIVLVAVMFVSVGAWNWIAGCTCEKQRWQSPWRHDLDCWRFPPEVD